MALTPTRAWFVSVSVAGPGTEQVRGSLREEHHHGVDHGGARGAQCVSRRGSAKSGRETASEPCSWDHGRCTMRMCRAAPSRRNRSLCGTSRRPLMSTRPRLSGDSNRLWQGFCRQRCMSRSRLGCWILCLTITTPAAPRYEASDGPLYAPLRTRTKCSSILYEYSRSYSYLLSRRTRKCSTQ